MSASAEVKSILSQIPLPAMGAPLLSSLHVKLCKNIFYFPILLAVQVAKACSLALSLLLCRSIFALSKLKSCVCNI